MKEETIQALKEADIDEKMAEYYKNRQHQAKDDMNWTKASKAMLSGKNDGGLLVRYIKEQGFILENE